ncbi:MAG TPA: DUF692 domain-containing protein [Steroidobacteraceae bacterium]|nr:DUF692 domain-containing protein [Steroidobacteraceae bacterium]
MSGGDRVGLAWRDELAAQIMLHLDAIDHLEIIAEREWSASRRRIDALRDLASQVPISLHGVSLGLVSSGSVSETRLERMARLVERVEPVHWSEHLAFVRAGGFEIGHLAAAPYAPQTLAGAFRNLERAREIVGSLPQLENIATLLTPPGSCWTEAEFAGKVVCGAGAGMLLDLHNLYANACNFGEDPVAILDSMPLERVASVHLSGGHWETGLDGRSRLIDDHIHDPPAPVYELLEVLALKVPQPLTVIIERDGHYPDFAALLEQITRARATLALGRARRLEVELRQVA